MIRSAPFRLLMFGLLSLFACVGLAATALYLQARPEGDFPYGVEIDTVAGCGTRQIQPKRGGLLIQQNRCIVTDWPTGDVYMWYFPRGEIRGDQFHIVETEEVWVKVIDTKRVEIINDRSNNTRMIRIYQTTSVLPPDRWFSFLSRRDR